MGIFDGVVNEIKTVLSQNSMLSDVNFINAYQAVKRPNYDEKIYATLGLSAVEISDAAFGRYFGMKNSNEIYGQVADISIAIKIYCPYSTGGEKCGEVFSRICDGLFFEGYEDNIVSASCKKVDYDGTTSTFSMDCIVKLRTFVGQSQDETNITNIIVKGVI